MKKIFSIFLSASFVFLTIAGGVGGNHAAPISVFAEENSEAVTGEELKAGVYTARLLRQKNESDSTLLKTSPLHFMGQAILNVGIDGEQTITIGVENWSLYEAFIPRVQGYVSESSKYLPSSIFNSDNQNLFSNFSIETYT